MTYIVFGVLVALCIGVIFLAWKIVKENRNMTTRKMDEDDDDELSYR